MLTRLVAAALAAALVAGIAVSAIQEFTTTPLILEAEKYEVEHHASTVPLFHLAHAGHTAGTSDNETDEWAPGEGVERTLYTSVATVGTLFGFALLLLGGMILAGVRIDTRNGLVWAAAAFAATGLAPALGLSPELPGAAAADLGARQFWWAGTAIATAAGLFLALRVSTVWAIVLGLVLIAAPHIIGAPHPHEFTSAVPSELSGHFAAASLVVHAIGWALTGVVAGYAWQRLSAGEEAAAA